MKLVRISIRGLLILQLVVMATASSKQNSSTGLIQLSRQNRVEIERAFTSDLVYARTPFPMGKAGLKVVKGQLTPNGAALQQAIDTFGLAAQRGDLVRITGIIIRDDHIRFEINGGPTKDSKWYQKITVYGPGGTPVPIKPKKPDAEVAATLRGSFVDLFFENSVRELTGPCLRELLRPVFDFTAKSSLEAYLDTVPPKVQQAIKDHRVLVGMNREMVLHAKGLPTRKVREKEGDSEYEDWIYGEPPQDMDFVRMLNNEVVRVETMKVNGERIIRTEKEVESPANTNTQNTKEESVGPDANPARSLPSGNPCSGRPANAPTSTAPVPSPNQSPTETGTPSSNCQLR